MLLSLQIIPLQQLGAMLFDNPVAEEVAHSTDGSKKTGGEKEVYSFSPAVINFASRERSVTNNLSMYANANLVRPHIADVPTPPPNS